jgi:hypothetical protein
MKLDIVFAVGAGGRDANEIFDKEKEIVNSFIDNLKDNDAQFAVIEFGNKASVKSKLGDEMDAGKLKASVSAIQRTGDGKCLDKALEQAVQVKLLSENFPPKERVNVGETLRFFVTRLYSKIPYNFNFGRWLFKARLALTLD